MRRHNVIRMGLILWLLNWGILSGSAQDAVDSMALAQAEWKVLNDANGMVTKQLSIRLFHAEQQIYCVELVPEGYRLGIVQDSLRKKTSVLGKESRADVAINGGFFKTKTPLAIAVGFIRTGGVSPSYMPGTSGSAMGIDSAGRLTLMAGIEPVSDSVMLRCFPDVMMAGPLLVRDARSLPVWDPFEPRHPRSCIGMKADGTLVLMVVDGRQEHADGMSLCELAYVTRLLGMVTVLNLDGGGSSTLWTKREGVLNRPSDRGLFSRVERSVCNAIVVNRRK